MAKTYKKRRKLDTRSFIELAKEVHGDKYIYDKSIFVATKKKLTITCPIHGDFEQLPKNHLTGCGCFQCFGSPTKTTEQFIIDARKVHGDKYDYSKVNYVNNDTEVPIICPDHGIFYQKPNAHLNGKGCADCSGTKKLTQEEFINRCIQKHNGFYTYDKTIYRGMNDYIIVTCPVHGDFEQLAAGHIRGKGCKDCAGTFTKTTEQFIEDAKKVHGDEYDYSKSKYINAMTPIEIICREHGSFWQRPNAHLGGKGCFECYGFKLITQEEFIERCTEKHNGFYIYDKTVYTGSKYMITVTCPIHGDFQQIASSHLFGKGCAQCAHLISTQELELREFLGTIYENEMIFNSRAFIKPKELDIYLPDIRVGFEFNGEYWHNLYEENEPGYHDYKRQLCKDNNIQLVEIWFKDWTEYNKETKNEIELFLLDLDTSLDYKHIQVNK